jgi:hypothetical protein
MCWRKPDDLDTALTELGEIGTVTGGSGTVGLWAWHTASELAVHRLDVENALKTPHSMSGDVEADAVDAWRSLPGTAFQFGAWN